MRKTLGFLAVVALIASPAIADITMTAKLGGHHSVFNGGSIGGGWFQVTRLDDIPGWDAAGVTADFRTYCVEAVYFTPNVTYYGEIGDNVLQGAVGDPLLTNDTKQLYAAFSNTSFTGALAGVDFATNANAIGGLQAALWELEGITAYTNTAYNAYKDAFLAWAAAQAAGTVTGEQNVRVLNLWKNADGTGDVQSQLVMATPVGNTVVPAPGAVALGLLGLGLVGWAKRRMS